MDIEDEQDNIMTGIMLEKTIGRRQRRARMTDSLGWGNIEPTEVENDVETWEELLDFLVKYADEAEEVFWSSCVKETIQKNVKQTSIVDWAKKEKKNEGTRAKKNRSIETPKPEKRK